MKNKTHFLKAILLMVFLCSAILSKAIGSTAYYYQLKIYHLSTAAQEERLDHYLKDAYLPALHTVGITQVGVFKPALNKGGINHVPIFTIAQDTEKRIYVLVPYSTWDQLENMDKELLSEGNKPYFRQGKDYINAAYNNLPYTRIETIILKAFPKWPAPTAPQLTANKSERIYELRSYENPTEQYNASKLNMFNEGGETALFKRLNFNAVFYAEVLAGSRMPNLMYMTAFNNMDDRNKHWDAFSNDPEWKSLLANPMYTNNVSKGDIIFLYPTEYSDL